MALVERDTSDVVKQALGERLLREMDPPVVSYITSVVNIDAEEFSSDLENLITTVGPMLESFLATEQQVRSTCGKIQQLLQSTFGLGMDRQTKKGDEPAKLRTAVTIAETDDGTLQSLDMIKSIRGEWRPESIQFKLSEKERKALEEKAAQKRSKRVAKEDTERAAEQEAKEEALRNVQSTVQLGGFPVPAADARDIRIEGFAVHYGRVEILSNATLVLNQGVRYGLVGKNGVGKSTLLRHIANRDMPLPHDLRIVYVSQEIEGTDTKSVDAVLNADEERLFLLALEKKYLNTLDEQSAETLARLEGRFAAEKDLPLQSVYTRLAEINADSAEARASTILTGLQFTLEMQQMPTRSLSGGWRMRIALARALFCEPDLLLLDEPTNHLDINAVVWLENYLTNWDRTLLVVSHNRDFLNNVTQQTIHFVNKQLTYYKGNYDNFESIRTDRLAHQKRSYENQQAARAHMQKFIDKLRYKTATAAMAQSRIKKLAKMDVIEKVAEEGEFRLSFPNPEPLSTPDNILSFYDVSFGYKKDTFLFEHLQFTIPLRCRIALVGPNGVGKSTLLNLFSGDLEPTIGSVTRAGKLRMAHFNQHSVDAVKDLTQNSVEYLQKLFPGTPVQAVRSHLGKFGLVGDSTLLPIGLLSGGQRSRLVLARMAWREPHVYLLDEPTNHLDIETVDALIRALNEFEGGVVLVSHDERLISLVADELWVCNRDHTVTLFEGDFEQYRQLVIEKSHIAV